MRNKTISKQRKAYIAPHAGPDGDINRTDLRFGVVSDWLRLGQRIPNISWELLSTAPSYLSDRIGILPDILNTVYIIFTTLLIVLPLGVERPST